MGLERNHYVAIRDGRTGKRYGGGPFPLGVPRVGDHVLTAVPRGRDVSEPRQWVLVTAVAWEVGRDTVTLYVVPEQLPVPYTVSPDGT